MHYNWSADYPYNLISAYILTLQSTEAISKANEGGCSLISWKQQLYHWHSTQIPRVRQFGQKISGQSLTTCKEIPSQLSRLV